jgi:uncharacterized alkaline shock family protein YloU
MDDPRVGPSGGYSERVAAATTEDAATHRGRIIIQDRVLERVSEQATATILGVDRRDVSVRVSEAHGGIAAAISCPFPVPDLDDTAEIKSGTSVLERAAAAQTELRERIAQLTGKAVTRVNITITGAVIARKKRVR